MSLFWRLFVTFLVVAFVMHWLGWFVLIGITFGFVRILLIEIDKTANQQSEERKRHDALITRCDQQHQWIIEGDERGIYGNYPPPKTTPDPQDQLVSCSRR